VSARATSLTDPRPSSQPRLSDSAGGGRVPLKGPVKAAALLLGLGEEIGTEVIKHLSDTEIRRLNDYAGRLDPKVLSAIEPTCEDFEKLMKAELPVGSPSTYFRALTEKAVGPDRATKLLEQTTKQKGPLEALRAARPAILAGLLAEEHPQVAAVIVSQLPSDVALGVIKAFAPELRTELVSRLVTLDEIPQQIADVASKTLAEMLASAGGSAADDRTRFDGVAFAARILNELPREETDEVLKELEDKNSQAATRVRHAMFTFEDLLRINNRGIQVLLKEVSTPQVLAALKTASEGLKEHFFSAVSSRAAATMREDMAILPPMRLSEVEAAQREIVECALRLGAEGRITLPTTGTERLV
jgi:flagellar motor switch protein FliG